ncbi:hypothetical protein CbuD7D7780_04340 [Coxiella burnetii]|uniref:Uncharacterized protein n=1 Tax=Coxiella burnetii (strain Dugway 5J108-111) TaxID=434922 RepID=A9KFD5_COXBN|nr:hypothetical protein [Coxiella burnetii]ABS76989.1 hypothetical protein CBUD_0844 [Coxiella burnetii Dugway 5J108-111]OYK80337.1 hypothetical protein CbuD7E6568_04320 [Coxiella burnetii]OYK82457.1 hypothetical protein CbuD7D7780_04340 [Coxiella burnetii]
MSTHCSQFWENFKKNNFSEAQQLFDTLNGAEKQAVLAELFQKSEYHRKPFTVSVLKGKLHDKKSFDDFYQAWLLEDLSDKVEIHGQVFQQGFPAPVRVINARNINDPNEIVSIGITWLSSKEEEKEFWNYLEKITRGEDPVNEIRHDRIKQVADRELLGLFRVETDDNLGVPF